MSIDVFDKCLVNSFACYVVFGAIAMAAGCATSLPPYVSSPAFDGRIVGVGYAVINAQPGESPEEKRLMAIKASKLEAYKSLAEQIYGQYLESRGTLSNLKLSDEEITSRVEGLIVGARVVSIKPISSDSYETVLEMGRAKSIDYLARKNDDEETFSTRQGSE
jgi:hypothetical protein